MGTRRVCMTALNYEKADNDVPDLVTEAIIKEIKEGAEERH